MFFKKSLGDVKKHSAALFWAQGVFTLEQLFPKSGSAVAYLKSENPIFTLIIVQERVM